MEQKPVKHFFYQHIKYFPKFPSACFYKKHNIKALISSNEDWVIPASDDERRYAAFDVSKKHQQDKVYFRALYDSFNTELPGFLHYYV